MARSLDWENQEHDPQNEFDRVDIHAVMDITLDPKTIWGPFCFFSSYDVFKLFGKESPCFQQRSVLSSTLSCTAALDWLECAVGFCSAKYQN